MSIFSRIYLEMTGVFDEKGSQAVSLVPIKIRERDQVENS